MRKITPKTSAPQPAYPLNPGQQEVLDGYLGQQIANEAAGKSDFKWKRGMSPVETVERIARAATFLDACALAMQSTADVADMLSRSATSLSRIHADMHALRRGGNGTL